MPAYLIYSMSCQVLKLLAVFPKESFFYEIGSSLPTSESWNRSAIFDTGHLWIFELHLSSRDYAISWQQLCRKTRISSPKSHPRRSQKWLGLAEEWLEKTKVTHQTNGTGQGPREITEPSTSTVCIDHRGPTAACSKALQQAGVTANEPYPKSETAQSCSWGSSQHVASTSSSNW